MDLIHTEILGFNDYSLNLAKKLIENEDVVGFPTETVYGLGALATSDKAVKRIYEVKGRPSDNPLIVHVHPEFDINELVYIDYDYVYKLMDAFLPGPLTMVYRSKGKVSSIVSCGLSTLAIRIPKNEYAQQFLRYVNLPIAAPSANISKHTSPVTASHVYDDFNGKISLILDGGKCEGGIESTVLDVTTDTPIILRSGLITFDMINEVVGRCKYSDNKGEIRAPGMKYHHYMPKCDTALFERNDFALAQELYDAYINNGKKPVFMCDYDMSQRITGEKMILGKTGEEIASNLYYMLRKGENKYDLIISFVVSTGSDLDVGIMNRLSKACKKY